MISAQKLAAYNRAIKAVNEIPLTLANKSRDLPLYLSHGFLSKSQNILVPLGGSDMTPVRLPLAKNIFIVDANPFLTLPFRLAFLKHDETSPGQFGIYHHDIAVKVSEIAPKSFATLREGYDHNSPYILLTEKFFDKTINEVTGDCAALKRAFAINEFTGEDIGLCTMILYRLRLICRAEILSMNELIPDEVFQIHIKKEDDTPACIYYIQNELGSNRQKPSAGYQWLKHQQFDTVLSRGFPDESFETEPLNTISHIQHDLYNLLVHHNLSDTKVFASTARRGNLPAIFVMGGETEKYLRTSKRREEDSDEKIFYGKADHMMINPLKLIPPVAIIPPAVMSPVMLSRPPRAERSNSCVGCNIL